jgi:three-Cys-motif partner protein
VRFDEIGAWSEIKLEIVRKYATAYSTILTRQPGLTHVYVDAFAGPGVHVSRDRGDFVAGSPLNALRVEPPFREYHLIDLDGDKVESLRTRVGDRPDVHLYQGDGNEILTARVFPRLRRRDARRALCLLDPYGLQLQWEVIQSAGRLETVEIFLNFPIMDMNRNVLWRSPERVAPKEVERMNSFWGDDSWRRVAYETTGNLFGFEEKTGNETIAEAFRQRLQGAAGFGYVPTPLPMRNSMNAIVYYLFFASPNRYGAKIVTEIFARYRRR